MSVSGLCQVCERAEARHSCPRCGRLVCGTHYDSEMGYCTVCATEIRQARGDTGEGGGGPGSGEVDEDDVFR